MIYQTGDYPDGNKRVWADLLSSEGGYTSRNVFACPGLKPTADKVQTNHTPSGMTYTGYGYNFRYLGSFMARSSSNHTPAKLSRIRYPSQCYLALDTNQGAGTSIGIFRVTEILSSVPTTNGFPDARHSGGLNILFVDGHVEWRKVTAANPYLELGSGGISTADVSPGKRNWSGGRLD
ncbi:hypothetical protein SDC9_176112 [bioreactor metagenome]|uniref:Uncharacterized protein n=1 Tax=bioreactor metagenome TaxID=1076179 RepID=A0A645GP24_9ZZZZ